MPVVATSPLQEKDRAKFGPEYGDRFCMLQLVGRHEMDKVQLQHESETNQKVRGQVHAVAMDCVLELYLLEMNCIEVSLHTPHFK